MLFFSGVPRGMLCSRLRINIYPSFGAIGQTTFCLYDRVKHPDVGTKAMHPIFFPSEPTITITFTCNMDTSCTDLRSQIERCEGNFHKIGH